VGYNPDFLLSAKSDVVVKGDFSDILPLLIGEQYKLPKSRSFSRREIIRSTIHIGGFLVPIVSLYLLSRYVIAFLIFLVTLLYIISELARMRGFNLPIISTITLNAAVKSEMHEFITAPIFYAMGIIIALILFSEPVGYASIATLTLGDGFAEIVGAKKGRHVLPYNRGKSIEGSAFGFVIAFIGASLFVSPLKALLGATIGMFVESLPTPVNDNLAIPIVSGFFMSLIP
jgi:dolichol kinase